MTVSIIVPMLNEAGNLDRFIAMLHALTPPPHEVIFVDGGSQDDSYQIAAASGFIVLKSSQGRAEQQNAGADVATGQILLFLHADTLLPNDALLAVENALNSSHIWGRFDVRLASSLTMLRVVAHMINLRSRWSGIATGDQAIFVLKDYFTQIGGFPVQPLMEDIELSKHLKLIQEPICLSQTVLTSARRWEKRGVWRTIMLMWRIRFLYWLGVTADKLVQGYQHER